MLRGDLTSVADRMQVVIDRFRRIGLQSPHEQTVKWAVALAALAIAESCGSYPTYSSVFAMVHDFKATLDSSRTNWPFGHMVDFPITATELPADVFRHAYDEDNPPVPFMWDRLAATAEHHVPLRKSSNLLKKDGASSSGPHMAQSAAQNQTVTWDQLRDLLQGRGGFQQGSSSLGHQAVKARMLGDVSPETPRTPHEADGLSSFQPHGRRFSALALPDRDREDVASPGPRVQEPLPAVPERQLVLRTAPALADTAPLAAAAASGAGGVGSAPATPKAIATPPETTRATTAEEYEARALAALVDRKEKKAIAKKAEAKKAGAKKRPAAAEESSADEPPAAPAAKKRPAAAVEPPSALDEAVIIFQEASPPQLPIEGIPCHGHTCGEIRIYRCGREGLCPTVTQACRRDLRCIVDLDGGLSMHAVCLLYACSYLYVVQSCIQFTHCALQRHVPVASATWLAGEALQVARTCGDPFSGR